MAAEAAVAEYEDDEEKEEKEEKVDDDDDDDALIAISSEELWWLQFLDQVLLSSVRHLEYLWAMTLTSALQMLPRLQASRDWLLRFQEGDLWRQLLERDKDRYQIAYYAYLILPRLTHNLAESERILRNSENDDDYRGSVAELHNCCPHFSVQVPSVDESGPHSLHTLQEVLETYNRLFFLWPVLPRDRLEAALGSLERYMGNCYGTYTVVPPWLHEADQPCILCHRQALVSGGNGIFEQPRGGWRCQHLVRLLEAEGEASGEPEWTEEEDEEGSLFRLFFEMHSGSDADPLGQDASEYAYWTQEGGGENMAGQSYRKLEELWDRADSYLSARGLRDMKGIETAGFSAYVGVPGISKPRFLALLEKNIRSEIHDRYRLSDPDVYGHFLRQLEDTGGDSAAGAQQGSRQQDIPLLKKMRTDPFSVSADQLRQLQQLQNDASSNRSKLWDVDNLKGIVAKSKATYANCYLTPLLGSGMAELGFAFRKALFAERVFFETTEELVGEVGPGPDLAPTDLDYMKGKQFTANAVRQFGLDEQLYSLVAPPHFNAYNYKQCRLRHRAAFALAAYSLGIRPHQIAAVESFARFDRFVGLRFSEQILTHLSKPASEGRGGLGAPPSSAHDLFQSAAQIIVLVFLHNISSCGGVKVDQISRVDDPDQLLAIRGRRGEDEHGDKTAYNLRPGLYVTWRQDRPFFLVTPGGGPEGRRARVLCHRSLPNLLRAAFAY